MCNCWFCITNSHCLRPDLLLFQGLNVRMITLEFSWKLWRDLECLGLRFAIRIILSKKRERANLSVGFIKYYIMKICERVDIGRYLHALIISTLGGSKCSPPRSSLRILTTWPSHIRPQIQYENIAPGPVWSFRIKSDSLKSYHSCMLYWSLLLQQSPTVQASGPYKKLLLSAP